MIGWYCNLGYSPSLANSIDDIIWTDTGRPFNIIEVDNISPVDVSFQTETQCYDKVIERIGDTNAAALYGSIPRATPYNDFTNLEVLNMFEYFPSFTKFAPNLLNIIMNGSVTPITYLYIPTLDLIYARYSSSTSVGGVGRISNGQINWIRGSQNIVEYGCNLLAWRGKDDSSIRNVCFVSCPIVSGNYKESVSNWGSIGIQFYHDELGYRYLESRNNDSNVYFFNIIKDMNPDYTSIYNPYEPGGNSGPGDLPPGTFDDSSDTIPDSSLPTLSAANTGFTRIYNPTLAQVQQLASYLWTDQDLISTLWNHLKQYFDDPMQAMIGFNLVPCAVPDGGTEEFRVLYIGTGVYLTVAANQFVDVDCGTYTLERYYGSALDQSPYTKVSCFLPYIGTVQLNTDEVMGTTLQVKYRIDIVSGSCVAKIFVDGSVLYQYSGHCAITIPFASADFSRYVQAAIQVATLGVGLAAGAGMKALAPATEEAVQNTGRSVTKSTVTTTTARNPNTGRQITTGTVTRNETINYPPRQQEQSTTEASFAGLTPANVSNTVGEIMSSKPNVEHSGSFSGNSGYLGVRRPFLIIERPNMCLPENYQHLNGYPAMITMTLGNCKGFTRVQQVQLTGFWATNPEQAEILQLLKAGVIF